MYPIPKKLSINYGFNGWTQTTLCELFGLAGESRINVPCCLQNAVDNQLSLQICIVSEKVYIIRYVYINGITKVSKVKIRNNSL